MVIVKLSHLPTLQKGKLIGLQPSKEVEGLGSDLCAGAEVGRALLSWNIRLHLPWPVLHRPYTVLAPSLSKASSRSGPKQKGLGRLHFCQGLPMDPQRGLSSLRGGSKTGPRVDELRLSGLHVTETQLKLALKNTPWLSY